MILACDSGGSKTLLCVYDKDICIEKSTLMGFGAAVDSMEDLPELAQKLAQLKARYPIEAVAFNLGGRNKGQIQRVIESIFPGIPYRVFRESEGHAAQQLGKLYNAQCVLLAGTGTIAIGTHPETGEVTISGGWGCLMGDQGSGYHIGIKALQHVVRQVDGVEELDLLSREILKRTMPLSADVSGEAFCRERDLIFKALSPLQRDRIAALTPIVAACCQKQDPLCLRLLQEAGIDMAIPVAQALRKLRLKKAEGILVMGGLVNIREYWQESFEGYLTAQFDIRQFHYISDGIIRGTQLIAQSLIK